MNKIIYLDNAATTFPKPKIVYDVMDKFLRESCVNAGRGSYELARNAGNIIDETRDLLLELVNGQGIGKVVFSPSATIATNQVLRGLNWNLIRNVYVSPFEHNAIMRTLHDLSKNNNFNINIIPFDNITFNLNESDLNVMFAKNKPDLIIMSHVSNVTGFILPILKIHELAKEYNPINIVDCAQSLGVVKVDIKSNFKYCDFIIFAGHKSLYGPLGVGGYINLNNKICLKPVLTGGTGSDSTNLEMPLEDGEYEPGSYNTYAIAGLNAGLKWIKKTKSEEIFKHEKELSNFIINKLSEIPEIELYVPENIENHIGVVSFNINGYSAEEIGKILDDDYGICVRTGHHCAPLIGRFLDGEAVNGTVRVSVGFYNFKNEVDVFIEKINMLI